MFRLKYSRYINTRNRYINTRYRICAWELKKRHVPVPVHDRREMAAFC